MEQKINVECSMCHCIHNDDDGGCYLEGILNIGTDG